ncbi:MAG: sigma-70 family RNA polymerase sigma factor [Anaerolineae bacterium]|nr:sigma-70 family RNA polymerase sigma factor [Anaerolineae bacterium]
MEQERIRAARDGDQAAIRWLIEEYQAPVYALCYRMLGTPQDAEDAAQEALVRGINNLDSFDLERPLRPWLLRVTSNLCIDRLRRRKFTISLDDMGEDGAWEWKAGSAISPERHLLLKEQAEQVRNLLAILSPQDRSLVTLFYWEELSYAEISAVTKLTESAIKSRLYRARRALARELLEEKQDGYTG